MNKEPNPKDIKYGLIVVDPTQESEMMDILHFVGYWSKPTKNDADLLREELMTDEEFGLTEIAHRLDILPAPDYIVKEYVGRINVMSKEQIIDEAYENYSKEYEKDNSIGRCLLVARMDGKSTYRKPDKEMFVSLCTHDKTFSERWGLKIEERELSLEERTKYKKKRDSIARTFAPYTHQMLDNANIPTKLITLTYNNEKIESYE